MRSASEERATAGSKPGRALSARSASRSSAPTPRPAPVGQRTAGQYPPRRPLPPVLARARPDHMARPADLTQRVVAAVPQHSSRDQLVEAALEAAPEAVRHHHHVLALHRGRPKPAMTTPGQRRRPPQTCGPGRAGDLRAVPVDRLSFGQRPRQRGPPHLSRKRAHPHQSARPRQSLARGGSTCVPRADRVRTAPRGNVPPEVLARRSPPFGRLVGADDAMGWKADGPPRSSPTFGVG